MIYIHVPFCHRKCTYCAFYSKPVTYSSTTASQQSLATTQCSARNATGISLPNLGEEPEVFDNYVEALLAEMEERKGEQAHPIKTVYFGGGTPSILPIDQLARVVEGLRRCFDLSQVEEVTLEANPEDLTPDYLTALRGLGFNRLSIGVQSLDDHVLRLLNRRHTATQAIEAVENAHKAGIHNISVDFIYGILDNLEKLEKLENLDLLEKVTHVSAYALTVEPGTALAVQVEQGRVMLPGDEEVVRQYHALHRQLEAAGFRQYEVSNYARPGFESKHNSRYWDRTPYLGLGPAAHSFDGKRRRWNVSSVEEYISRVSRSSRYYEDETLTAADAYNEMLMTSLRTVRGLNLAQVPEQNRKELHHKIQPYIDCGWIVLSTLNSQLSTVYCPTTEGLLHADGMAAALFV